MQDERSRRSILAVRRQQLMSMLPCDNCVGLLANAAGVLQSEGEDADRTKAPSPSTSAVNTAGLLKRSSNATAAAGVAALQPAPNLVLHKLVDGSWITQDYLQPQLAGRSVLRYSYKGAGGGGGGGGGRGGGGGGAGNEVVEEEEVREAEVQRRAQEMRRRPRASLSTAGL